MGKTVQKSGIGSKILKPPQKAPFDRERKTFKMETVGTSKKKGCRGSTRPKGFFQQRLGGLRETVAKKMGVGRPKPQKKSTQRGK